MRTRTKAPDEATSSGAVDRQGSRAALVAVLCVAACVAAPLAVGGIALVSGALVGRWLAVAGALLATAIVGVFMLRGGGRSTC